MTGRRAWMLAATGTVASLLAGASFRVCAEGKGRTVCVWDFDNSSLPDPAAPPWVDGLQRILPEALIAGFNRGAALTPVERIALRDVLSEQKIGASDLADDRARLKLGRIAGARHMVFGTYMVMDDQVRVEVRSVDVETSLVEFTDSIEGSADAVIRKMDPTAQKIARAVGGSAPKSGGSTAEARVWNDYDRGLVLMDAGKYREAIESFKQLLAKFPDFKPAEKQVALAAQRLSRQ